VARSGSCSGPPGIAAPRSMPLQRGPHPRNHPGDLASSASTRDRRPLFIGFEYARALEAGLRDRARGPGCQGSTVMVGCPGRFSRDPVVSHAVLGYNRGRRRGLADGIVITPSHNPRSTWLQVRPAARGPADTHVPGGSRACECLSRRRPTRRGESPVHRAAPRRPPTGTTTSTRTCAISRPCGLEVIRASRAAWGRPHGRRQRRVLGRDREK